MLFAYFGKEANQLMDLLSGKGEPHPGQIWLMVFDVVVGLVLLAATIYFGKKIHDKGKRKRKTMHFFSISNHFFRFLILSQ